MQIFDNILYTQQDSYNKNSACNFISRCKYKICFHAKVY